MKHTKDMLSVGTMINIEYPNPTRVFEIGALEEKGVKFYIKSGDEKVLEDSIWEYGRLLDILDEEEAKIIYITGKIDYEAY